MLIVARNSMPAKNLLELIAWLKANPDKATGAIGGRADITDVVFALFKKETGTSFQTVPYRGATLALNDLISGQIDLTLLAAGFTLPQIQAGSFKAYAVFAKNRLPQAPDIPTTDEAGLPGFYIPYWSALWAPKNTPRPIIDRLNAAAVDALADPKVRARLTDPGREIYSRDQQTPEALAALQDAEIKKWWPVVKEAGIKAE
jgi:tripartite-type tricarboxylate transporter receptor subunit TctC